MPNTLRYLMIGRLGSWLLRALRFAPAAVLMAGIFYVSSKPPSDVPGFVKHFVRAYLRGDGTAHFLAYATLAAAIIWALRPYFRRARWSIALGWLVASAYAAIDECHQLFVPGRSASVWEFLIDSLGALVSCLAWVSLCFLSNFKRGRIAAATSSQMPEEEGGADEAPEAAAQGDHAAP